MANNLKTLRHEAGLTQKQFAEDFNDFLHQNKEFTVFDNKGQKKSVSYATISRWENGRVPIPYTFVRGLANFANVSEAYLLGLNREGEKCPYCHGKKALGYKKLEGTDVLRAILMPKDKMIEFYYYADDKGEAMTYIQANYCPVCGRKL